MALFTVYLKLFYMQNGTFGLPKLTVTAAFALAKIERDRERKGKTEIKVLVKYVDLLYDEVETPQKALRACDIWGGGFNHHQPPPEYATVLGQAQIISAAFFNDY